MEHRLTDRHFMSSMTTLLTPEPYLHLPSSSRLLATSGNHPEHRATLFLDRDGVIIEDVNFLTSVDCMRLLPGVVQALKLLQQRFYLVVVSNQSGLARGYIAEPDLLDIHSELVRRLEERGVGLDALYYCPHLPEGTIEAFKQECECRKPKPGMLLRAMKDWNLYAGGSFMVGDSARDKEAGERAGVKGLLVGQGWPDSEYGSLGDVAEVLMTRELEHTTAAVDGDKIGR